MTSEGKLHSNPAQAVRDESAKIQRDFLADGDAASVLARRTRLVDTVLTIEFQRLLEPAFPTGLALVCVGGYGRRELFPHSDIDLMFLVPENPPVGAAKEALALFMRTVWDAGLRLSHSVHNVRECCEIHEGNIELTVSLLDRRFLCGDQGVYESLSARIPKFLQSQRAVISRQLCRLAHQRHSKFHNTIYHLEPNIKEGPGGLRDLQLLAWLEMLSGGSGERRAQAAPDADFLFRLRCFLHYRSNRDNNLLSFEAQEEYAELPFEPAPDAAAAMREYFRHARGIQRAALRATETFESKSSSLLAGFRDWRSRLSSSEFTVSRDRVLFRSPQQLEKDPATLLRLFLLVGRHMIPLHPETERRIHDRLPLLADWFDAPPQPVWPALREILTLPHASFALRAMHETGVLKALFPEWAGIECYVVRDFNHRYTVDEHTLVTLESLEELAATKDPGRRRFANLMSEIEDLSILRLALLFHDVGKGGETDSHAIESGRLAQEAALRIGVPEEARALLIALIERHLVLSAAMNGRDLVDPSTARWLAERVGTIEVLKNLTLLTFGDISAVHPTAMSPWRLEQLWRVYVTAHRELTRELDTNRIQSAPASAMREAFLKGFPTRYLRIHSDAEIAYHMELDAQRRETGMALDIQKRDGVYHLTVLAKDRLFLFASMAGALASFGMNILKAEAFANQQGTILDTFAFADPQRTLELNPPDLDRLRQTLERVLLGKLDVKSLLRNRPRPSPPSKSSGVPNRVSFDNEASDSATLVEVITQDRPGLLYDLASAISEAGCSIEVVLVDTEAHKALDVFYLTSNGRKLDPPLRELLQARLIERAATG
jgi:[protein-PII] uridylyltransferase